MKKISFMALTIMAMLSFGVIRVNAVTLDAAAERTTEFKVEGNKITLLTDVDTGLEVKSGQDIILDLAGHKLTNYCLSNGNCPSVAIHIQAADAKLTIMDSDGRGVVAANTAKQTKTVSTIVNEGTLIIKGGTFEAEGVNEGVSTIYNNKTLIIDDGTFKSGAKNAAAIHNASGATLEFNDGTIETGVQGSWGLTNAGTATIGGGVFVQKYDYSVIQNSGTMTIEDGEFKAEGSSGHNALITNQKTDGGGADLDINGGNFTSDLVFSSVGNGDNPIEVYEGTFSKTTGEELDVSTYYADPDNTTQTESGKVVHKHTVTLGKLQHGKADVSAENPYEDDEITITPIADKDYALDKVVVKTTSGKIIPVRIEDGKAIFTMPSEDVTVTVTFKLAIGNPNTLDNITLYVALSIMSVILLAMASVCAKKVLDA